MSKFTKGPWSVDDEACFIFGRDGHMVAELRGVGVKRTEGELVANGYLIAAAPDLLEVAKRLLADYGSEITDRDLIDEANAAIARAEGRHE